MINRYSASFAPVTLQTLPATRRVVLSAKPDPTPQPTFQGKEKQNAASTWFTVLLLGASIIGAYKVLESKISKPAAPASGPVTVQSKITNAK